MRLHGIALAAMLVATLALLPGGVSASCVDVPDDVSLSMERNLHAIADDADTSTTTTAPAIPDGVSPSVERTLETLHDRHDAGGCAGGI